MENLKNRTQNDYTMISNLILRDESLSMKERGMLCTICSLPEGWAFSLTGLVEMMPDGIDAIRATVNKLECKGYLKRRQIRTEDGKFAAELEVYDKPCEEDGKREERKA